MDIETDELRGVDTIGRVVLPKKFREALGITDKVKMLLTKDGILIKKPCDEGDKE